MPRVENFEKLGDSGQQTIITMKSSGPFFVLVPLIFNLIVVVINDSGTANGYNIINIANRRLGYSD